MNRRLDVKKILDDPILRKKLFVDALVFIQAVEGIQTTKEQAEAAYDKVLKEKK